jgi:drug/metabolite transporter (DMT)-like permease
LTAALSPLHRPNAPAAIGLVLLATLGLSMMDASTKYLSALLPLSLVVWARYTLQTVLMAAMLGRGAGPFRPRHPRQQLLRGLLLLSTSVLGFYSLHHMPLAEFTALVMLSPVLLTAVSARLNREPIGGARWLLVFGGFAGTLAVVQPGSELPVVAVALALLTTVAFTAFNLISSRLAGLESVYTTQFCTGLIGSVLMLPLLLLQADAALAGLRAASPLQCLVLGLLGVFGTGGHLLLIQAFARASAAALMPFTYVQIGHAALLSWAVFGHAPNALAWLGMAVIAGCGGCAAWLNMRQAQRAGVPPTTFETAVD